MNPNRALQIRRAATGAQPASAIRGLCTGATLFWLAVVGLSAVVQDSPALQLLLQYDRAAISAGEVWRLLTGHLVHFGWGNWAANVGTFAALCWIAQGRARGLAHVVSSAALLIGTGLYAGAARVSTYRGISGVDCALFGWVLVSMARQDGGLRAAVYVGAVLLWMAKSLIESATGRVLLPTSAPAGVEVVGMVHVLGLAIGAGSALVPLAVSKVAKVVVLRALLIGTLRVEASGGGFYWRTGAPRYQTGCVVRRPK